MRKEKDQGRDLPILFQYINTIMKIETNQGDIKINIPKHFTKIGLKHSGGLDSTILAYILALYKREFRPEIDIIPITLVQSTKPFQWMYAHMTQEKITELTGIEFGKHYFRMYESANILEGQDELVIELYNEEIIEAHFYGVTLNPPLDAFPLMLATTHDGTRLRDTERDPLPNGKLYPTLCEDHLWQPFANIDKRGINDLYNRLGVMDELFPLTHSCENYNAHTGMQLDLSKHCGQVDNCWWCAERKWGFGRLDGLPLDMIRPS